MFGRHRGATAADELRKWVQPYLEPADGVVPGMSDGIVMALPGQVAELALAGNPIPVAGHQMWAVLADSALMISSAQETVVVKWFQVQMWQLVGSRMFVGWLSPTLQTLDSVVFDIDTRELKARPQFEPVAKRLLDLAHEALPDVQRGGFAEIAETIDARDAGHISPEDSAAHISRVIAAMQAGGRAPAQSQVSPDAGSVLRRPAPKRRR